MNSGYLYIIQEGDTVKSIAKALDLTSFEIVGYHNAWCLPEEKIIDDKLPKELEYLLLRDIPTNISSEIIDYIIERKHIDTKPVPIPLIILAI